MLFMHHYSTEVHIEHFWCSAKKLARDNCQYTLEDLRRRVPRALPSVPNKTILAYYYRCQRKMYLYSKGLLYGAAIWKARTVSLMRLRTENIGNRFFFPNNLT